MSMSEKRFDELKLEDSETECPYCKLVFSLQLKDTTGGGYGVIGVKCRTCKKNFAIDGGAN